jgi:hypothetical protein
MKSSTIWLSSRVELEILVDFLLEINLPLAFFFVEKGVARDFCGFDGAKKVFILITGEIGLFDPIDTCLNSWWCFEGSFLGSEDFLIDECEDNFERSSVCPLLKELLQLH